MGCIKLDILERAPSKRSSQIRMGSNCKPITKKGVSTYTFGFNGKEMDNEVSGDGNQYDYGFSIYNPRIAKFLSVDPLTRSYPMLTPYQFASNTPIWAIDLDGLEAVDAQYAERGKTYGATKLSLSDEKFISALDTILMFLLIQNSVVFSEVLIQ